MLLVIQPRVRLRMSLLTARASGEDAHDESLPSRVFVGGGGFRPVVQDADGHVQLCIVGVCVAVDRESCLVCAWLHSRRPVAFVARLGCVAEKASRHVAVS